MKKQINTFSSLRNNQDFCDVTLVCEDNMQIEAHKIILSATSSFLNKILFNVKHTHPLIYFLDIKERDLLKILDFIYMGEVEVYNSDLVEFLNLAAKLGITGISENNTVTEDIVEPDTLTVKIKEESFGKLNTPTIGDGEIDATTDVHFEPINTHQHFLEPQQNYSKTDDVLRDSTLPYIEKATIYDINSLNYKLQTHPEKK